MATGMENGWPISFACCDPVDDAGRYCAKHHDAFFSMPELKGNKYARSLRKITS